MRSINQTEHIICSIIWYYVILFVRKKQYTQNLVCILLLQVHMDYFFQQLRIKFQCQSPRVAWKQETKEMYFSIAAWGHLKHFCILVVYCFNLDCNVYYRWITNYKLYLDNYVMKMEIKVLLFMALRVLILNNFLLLKMSFTTLRKSPERQYFCGKSKRFVLLVSFSNGKYNVIFLIFFL